MPKGSPELTQARKDEIIAACEQLYRTMSFKEITLKEIGKVTSFTRTSIYNYFHTKEEIFLALLKKEYELWIEELQMIMESNEKLSRTAFAEKIAMSLEHRQQLLKVMSMNMYDMEENSRMERLVEFKQVYGKSLKTFAELVSKFFPVLNAEGRQTFVYQFFPFIYGIYPYTSVTEKQKEAMKEAGVGFAYMSVYEITLKCLLRLLPDE
ncbi:MAG: TetR/AcrR family transcriptional regulator [Ruminococcus flavefaciens]|nr:TetR/AcrR family transcriptional regulator [Ruminococcus flavefaciens]